jgi:gliding motility-associated-like protein
LEYSIDGGTNWQPANLFTGLNAGSYTVIVRDEALCATAWTNNPVIINNIGGATITDVLATDATCGNSDGSITITATGGTGLLEYSIDGGTNWQPTNLFTGLNAGSYTVIVRDEALCATAWINNPVIINNIGGATITGVLATDATCGNSDGSITITATGGTGLLEYSIDGGTNWQPANLFTGLNAGSYTVIVRDEALCATAWINNPVIINSIGGATITDVSSTDEFCSSDNGTISILATGTAPMEYSIDNGLAWQSLPDFSSLTAGNYTIVVRDATLCEITWPTPIVINDQAGPVIVNLEVTDASNGQPDGEVNIVANGGLDPMEYQVDALGWQTGTSFTGLTIGTHTAWVRDANGCLTSQEFIISNLVTGEVIISAGTMEYCMNVPVIVPVDANNFTEIASFEIELQFDPAILLFNGLININSALSGGTFSVSVTGNLLSIRYSVFSGSVTVPTGAQLFGMNFTALTPGMSDLIWNTLQYTIYTPEGYEMLAIFTQGEAEILPAPKIGAEGGGTFCAGDSTTLIVTSLDAQMLNYQWSGPGGFTSTLDTLVFQSLETTNSGDYTLVAMNNESCIESKPFILEVNPSPVLSIAQSDSLCAGTTHLLDAGPGYESYLWQDGSVVQSVQARDAGIYSVQVVNSYGCTGGSSVELIPCSLEIAFPSAFTPDANNLNDIFRPVIEGDVQPSWFYMQIYNKWGELIYETSDYSAGWDGTFKGSPAPSGVYVFVVSFQVPGYINTTSNSPVRGSVTLLR